MKIKFSEYASRYSRMEQYQPLSPKNNKNINIDYTDIKVAHERNTKKSPINTPQQELNEGDSNKAADED